MEITFDREKRREQKDLLKKIFGNNYLPIHHDAFVMEYNRIIETNKLTEYMTNRGIK